MLQHPTDLRGELAGHPCLSSVASSFLNAFQDSRAAHLIASLPFTSVDFHIHRIEVSGSRTRHA